MSNKIIFFLIFSILVIAKESFATAKADQYTNKEYGFSVSVPADWILYRQGKGLNPERWIINWGLPKIWSSNENAQIENSISISVLKQKIFSIDELIKIEHQRVKDILVSQKKNDLPNGNKSIVTITKINGLLYKSKTTFFLSNNKGYIINFTATKGTYKINLPRFEIFVKSLTFNIKK